MEFGTIALAFLAGSLSILSPCVLPLLPVVLGAAVAQHRAGPVALALGLALSFVVIGMFVATIGFGLGLYGDTFRTMAAIAMVGVGIVMFLPKLQLQFATLAGPAGQWAQNHFGNVEGNGLSGQFGVGLLLGAVWSPCVGPTLGAASVLASQGESLWQVAFTMLAFGMGAGLPLAALGLLSRKTLMGAKGQMLSAGAGMKQAMGVIFVAIGLLILTGLDKKLEAILVTNSPEWLTWLTTRF